MTRVWSPGSCPARAPCTRVLAEGAWPASSALLRDPQQAAPAPIFTRAASRSMVTGVPGRSQDPLWPTMSTRWPPWPLGVLGGPVRRSTHDERVARVIMILVAALLTQEKMEG